MSTAESGSGDLYPSTGNQHHHDRRRDSTVTWNPSQHSKLSRLPSVSPRLRLSNCGRGTQSQPGAAAARSLSASESLAVTFAEPGLTESQPGIVRVPVLALSEQHDRLGRRDSVTRPAAGVRRFESESESESEPRRPEAE
eukprot:2904990-Rhodomonas_salina.2